MSDAIKPVRISGELFWSRWMAEHNKQFSADNIKYECTLGALSDRACQALEELGIKIKERDPMGKFVVAKSLHVFKPVDEDGNPIDISKIGNGTKVVAVVTAYRHKMSAKHGLAPSIKKLVVTELKVYNPEAKVAEDNSDDIL